MSLRASLEYIVVDYAINECEWLDLQEEAIVEEVYEVIKPRFVGWAVLGENESRKRGLFDEQNIPETTEVNGKRSLRSANKM